MLVKCWNVSDGQLLYTFRGGAAEVSDMTVSHDNRMLAVATLGKNQCKYGLTNKYSKLPAI